MKLRRALISTFAIGAILAPSAATAADVHITINFSHVTRDGRQKLKVSGVLHPFQNGCESNRLVKIQRKTSAGWKTIGQDTTSSGGGYSKIVADRQKRYRTFAPAGGGCESDVSDVKRHRH